MAHKKTSKLGLGLVLGAVAGAVAGLFLAPKPGKELREDAKNLSKDAMKKFEAIKKELADKEPEEAAKIIFGHVTEEGMAAYSVAKDHMALHLAQLGKNYKTVDKKKYSAIVKDAVEYVRTNQNLPDEHLKRLTTYLGKDFKKLTAKTKKKAKKKARKTSAANGTKKKS